MLATSTPARSADVQVATNTPGSTAIPEPSAKPLSARIRRLERGAVLNVPEKLRQRQPIRLRLIG
jgi:hypothetical protein